MKALSPSIAYDLELSKQPPARGSPDNHGWCYGLPPGITETQWPLSPFDGFPMQPCFTLRLPEQYRTQGPGYVALTMFADQQYDEPREVETIAEYLAADTLEPPSDPDLLPFWRYKRGRHAREFRMQDIIGHNFAAIWLTEEEFRGPLCHPPQLAGNRLLRTNPPPMWIEKGAARMAFDCQIDSYDSIEEISGKYWYRLFERVPEIGHHAFGIAMSVRSGDPNVGRPPRDHLLHKDELGDYVAPSGKQAETLGLDRLSGRNHLGGTMFPCQWTPRFGPFYLEIEEHFGGFNFGGGNAQLDLETMAFDWACG